MSTAALACCHKVLTNNLFFPPYIGKIQEFKRASFEPRLLIIILKARFHGTKKRRNAFDKLCPFFSFCILYVSKAHDFTFENKIVSIHSTELLVGSTLL